MEEKKPFDPVMYIVFPRELLMPPGKLAAQAGHAAVDSWIDSVCYKDRLDVCKAWRENGGAKICVAVQNVSDLHTIHHQMIEHQMPCALVEDAGHTVFAGPTVTCIGVGPLWRSESESLGLKHLPLY